MWWWFWLWILFIFFLIALPLGYGSGYRRWGAPYPRYYHYRGRSGRLVRVREDELVEPAPRRDGWGWFADVVWLLLILAVVWIVVWAWVY